MCMDAIGFGAENNAENGLGGSALMNQTTDVR